MPRPLSSLHTPKRSCALLLLLGVLLGPATVSAEETLASLLSHNLQEISHSAVPTPEHIRAQVCDVATATLARHINLQPGGISTTVYQSGKTRIYVHWKDFVFSSIQPATIVEADRLNGVSAKFRIIFYAKAYRTWKTGDKKWAKWKSARYRAFPDGITVQQVNGQWVTGHDPKLNYFRAGSGVAVIKPAQSKADPGLPPGVTRQP